MAVWNELKKVLARLRDEQPCPLMTYPTLEGREHEPPPFWIQLAPWAATTAADLHRRFGHDVRLTVGALPFPPRPPSSDSRATGQSPDLLDPHQIVAELDGRAVVSSGHTLRHGLRLHNLTNRKLQIATNGHVTAVVVDPDTGEVVGGYSAGQRQPLILFPVAPKQTGRVPLLIGTASFIFKAGYAIPAGDWGIQATVTVWGDPSGPRRTPVLPLTITA